MDNNRPAIDFRDCEIGLPDGRSVRVLGQEVLRREEPDRDRVRLILRLGESEADPNTFQIVVGASAEVIKALAAGGDTRKPEVQLQAGIAALKQLQAAADADRVVKGALVVLAYP